MRYALPILLLGCIPCPAGTIYDVFNQSQSGGCSYSFAPPYSSCDVIGDAALYDIQKADVHIAAGWTTVTIYFNYGGWITLQPFDDGIQLEVGDLFFYAPSDPGNYLYGVPLYSHGGFSADDLYRVGGDTTLLTADDIIHNTGYYYRRSQDVWLGGSGSPEAIGLPVQVVDYGDGVSNALYAATLQFPTPADFLASVLQDHQVGIAFASAYCANDVIEGTVAAAPEPKALGLLAVGTALLGGFGAWQRRRAKQQVRASRSPS